MFYIHLIILMMMIFLQAYFPVIYLDSITISPDIILVYLSIMVILFSRYKIILLGFFLGLIQDLIFQVSLLGLFSFLKSLCIYLVGSIALYDNVWSRLMKYTVLFSSYFIHFFIYFFIIINDNASWIIILQYSTLQTLFSFMIFWLINEYFFVERVI